MIENNIYKFNKDDLYECFNFVKNYHLDLTKGSIGRTNQGKRSFGGELDAFLPGKLVEIGTCKIIEKFCDKKILHPDFEIYTNYEVGQRSDPDITKVSENGKKRKANKFIEIKKFEPSDVWLGPRWDQFKGKLSGYMIHSRIYFEDEKNPKERDIVASALKEFLHNDEIDLGNFSNFDDLNCKIEYIYSFEDVKNKGFLFKAGDIILKTEIDISQKIINKDGSIRKGYELLESFNGNVELDMKWGNYSELKPYSKWVIEGKFSKYINIKSKKEYIHTVTSTYMFNEVLGEFNLDEDTSYKFHFENKLGTRSGKDVLKGIDDYWFSKKRLNELIKNKEINSLEENLIDISNQI